MLTEFMLTDEQRKQIAEIDKQIFDLQLKRSLILMAANSSPDLLIEANPVNILIDPFVKITLEENWQRFARFGEPVIKNDAVVKIISGEKEE